ncbi:UTRA domain-containing protein [Rhizobium leguminosarum bv. viciae]|nr:UTRA domain-containing protein [Rhizobium leguminosarum bv. viciae]
MAASALMRSFMNESLMTVKDSAVSSVPIYVSVQKDLLTLIHNGDIEPGGRFPSERELSVMFGASRMTMRKAVDHLVQSGVLERRGTSGTYVPDRLFDRPMSDHTFYSISDVVEKAGHTPGSKLLFFERKEADEFIASKLGLSPGDPVISIERLRTVDGVPVCLELSHFPALLVPRLSASDVMENKSLYKLFKDNYQLELTNDVRVISIHYATKGEAELLDLRPGAPVLHFEGLSLTGDGQPFEHLRSLNHPDRVSLTINPPPEKQGPKQSNPIGWMLQS